MRRLPDNLFFTLAHLSDPHFGAVNHKVADAVPEALCQLGTDAVLVTGDFTMRGRRSEFLAAKDWLNSLPGPVITIPGNHDIPGFNNLWDRLLHPFKRYRHYVAPRVEGHHELGPIHLECLNSSRRFGSQLDWSQGRVTRHQQRVVRRRFEGTAPHRLRLLALHHPTIAPPENRRALVAPVERARKMLSTNRIDLVLGGHFHQSYAMTLQGQTNDPWRTMVSQVSTATSTRLQGEPNGFHLIHFEAGNTTIERHTWERGKFRQTDQFRFRPDATYGWLPVGPEDRPRSDGAQSAATAAGVGA
jgi:3',5'-cyclic AMP phosphodiesterase CpdA